LLSPDIELYVVHVEEVANICSTSKLVYIAALCDDLAEGGQTYAEQQWEQIICLFDTTLECHKWTLRLSSKIPLNF